MVKDWRCHPEMPWMRPHPLSSPHAAETAEEEEETAAVVAPHCGDPESQPSILCPHVSNHTGPGVRIMAAENNNGINATAKNATTTTNDLYKGNEFEYDARSMGFAMGFLVIIGALFGFLIFTDCSRKYRFKKNLYQRPRAAIAAKFSSSKKQGQQQQQMAQAAASGAAAATIAPFSARPFDAAAQMESGHASGSEAGTTLQADPRLVALLLVLPLLLLLPPPPPLPTTPKHLLLPRRLLPPATRLGSHRCR
ncbi:hypothetical protein PG994_008236 [Apiospora phragmitis]|uniref:FXYD domain-containing ion transport regulator n=1 Tax=Apiospora phragmitis TaxID=2905665 RepID=A0ABR1USG2_9PEZI